ncbi:hypothetical protein SESBI_06745 [Sesbania bispinosa]|nr:hypothetical protein SESBI_06745 [Sesbania bispinosa]
MASRKRKVALGEGSSDFNKATPKKSKKSSTRSSRAVKKRGIVHDRSFDISENDYKEVYDTITSRGWKKFCETAGMDYYSLTREFYVNAHHDKQEAPTFVSFVRGKEVSFDAQTINKVLKIKLASHPGPNGHELYRQEELHEDIVELMCKPGVGLLLDNKGRVKGSRMGDLKPIPKACDIVMEIVHLLYAILIGIEIDVGKIIAQEMDKIVVSGKQTLAYPSIIALLCREAKVQLRGDDKIKPYPSITKGSIYHFEFHYDIDLGKQSQRVTPTRMILKDQRLMMLADRQDIMLHNLYSLRQGITFGLQKLNQRYECLEKMIVQLGAHSNVDLDQYRSEPVSDSQIAGLIALKEFPDIGAAFGSDEEEKGHSTN